MWRNLHEIASVDTLNDSAFLKFWQFHQVNFLICWLSYVVFRSRNKRVFISCILWRSFGFTFRHKMALHVCVYYKQKTITHPYKLCKGVQLCFVYNKYCFRPFDKLLIEHFTKHVDFFNCVCMYIYITTYTVSII